MRRGLALLILISQPSLAEVALVYEPAPELSCPPEETLRRLIAARLGNDPFVEGGDSRVTVRIKAGAPVLAEVELASSASAVPRRKLLSGPDCAALLNSVALTVALAVDPLLRKTEPPPVSAPPPVVEEPPPAPPTSPPSGPVQAAPAAKPAPEPRGAGLHGSISAGASVNIGLSLGAQPMLRVEGRLHGSRWSIGLEGRFGWPVTGSLSEGALTTSAILGAVVPCLTWGWFSGCADLSLGALRLEGHGLTAGRQATVFHASVGLRALFAVPLGEKFSLGLLADGQVPLTRTSALVGTTRAWAVWPVGGGLGVWAGLAL